MYYIFNSQYTNQIAQAFLQVNSDGFFDFKPHQKTTEITSIPTSNTDSTPIKLYRTVLILEVASFATEDAELEAQAGQLAEFVSNNPSDVLEYLQTPDLRQ